MGNEQSNKAVVDSMEKGAMGIHDGLEALFFPSRAAAKRASVGQAPVSQHPSGHSAGHAETKLAFNNHMERVIGKTFIILLTLTPSILEPSLSSGAFALWWLEEGSNTGLHIDQASVAFTVL